MHIIASADITVPVRFHGTVLSLLAERPNTTVYYYRKMADLLRAMGQGRFALDLNAFTADELEERFRELEAGHDDARKQIGAKNREYREAADRQME